MSLPWCITFLAILCAFYILFFVLFNFYDPTNFFSLLFSSNMLLFSYVRLQKPEPLVFPVKLFYKAYVRLLKSPTTMLMSYIFYLVFFMVFDAIKFECKHMCSSILLKSSEASSIIDFVKLLLPRRNLFPLLAIIPLVEARYCFETA